MLLHRIMDWIGDISIGKEELGERSFARRDRSRMGEGELGGVFEIMVEGLAKGVKLFAMMVKTIDYPRGI